MVTSKEILEHTGLKSAKTLTRWYQRGIIPKPSVRTHPSGRGKIAYWPDWVLERCVRIVELQKQGHSLHSAATMMQIDRLEERITIGGEAIAIFKEFANKQVKLQDGQEISVLDIFLAIILREVKRLASDRDLHDTMLTKMKAQDVLTLALSCLRSGYIPVLFFDGEDLSIVPEFVVCSWLGAVPEERNCYLVIPLLPCLRKTFTMVGKELPLEPQAFAAPKIWAKEKGTIVEYMFYPAGPHGFELIRQTATIIGTTPVKPENKGES